MKMRELDGTLAIMAQSAPPHPGNPQANLPIQFPSQLATTSSAIGHHPPAENIRRKRGILFQN
jgi:hypothetical protein